MDEDFGRFPKGSPGEKIPVPPRKPLKLDDVPMWTLLPYDSKYPLTEYSKKVIAREEIGKSLYHTFPRKEFDLSQFPVPVVKRTDYEPLHDPHLRHYFHHAWRYRNLISKGLVTKDGRVKSRLKDYNQYRMYLYHLWAMQVNQLNRTQMLEEKKRLENFLKAHETGDNLFKDVTKKYDKIKIEEILDEVTFKMHTDGTILKKYGWSPLIQSAIRWKTYQEKLKKNFRLSYPTVKQWLCEQTRHYKQFIERKLNARRNREKKNRGRWEKIYENSLARLQKELKLQAQEKEKKRALSEQRYNRAKIEWEKNERKISLKTKKCVSKSFTDLSLAYAARLREWNITDIGSTSFPDVSAVEKYSPAPRTRELQKFYQEESTDFKQALITSTKEKNSKQNMKFEKTISENELINNIQPANYTNADHDTSSSNLEQFTIINKTTFNESYHTMDDGEVGQKSKSIRQIPKDGKIDKEIEEGKSKEILVAEESSYMPSGVSKHKIRKKEKSESLEAKSLTGEETQTKTAYRKELPAVQYFHSNTDKDRSSHFDSFKRDKRIIFDENNQTVDDGAVGKIFEIIETIPKEERKIIKETVDAGETEYLPPQAAKHKLGKKEELNYFQKKLRGKKQTKIDYRKNIQEEKNIDKELIDAEPKEILDVKNTEYLPTQVLEHKIKKEQFDSFEMKSLTGGDKQTKTVYGKKLPTKRHFDSTIDQDTLPNFDSFRDITTIGENDQTLRDGTVEQKSESYEIIPEEERKFDTEITDSKPKQILDVEEIEYLPTEVLEHKIRKEEKLDSFKRKLPKEIGYEKELSMKRYLDSNVDQDTSSDFNSFKKENITIFDETDCKTLKQKFASTENIYEEKEIDKITDGEPKEILDVEEREYLPTHVSKHKTERNDKSDYFQIKSPIGGAEEMKIDTSLDTSPNFDSFRDIRTIGENDQTLRDDTVEQKSESYEIIPEEERKFDTETTDSKPKQILDVEEIEYLPTEVLEHKIRKEEKLDSFKRKLPKEIGYEKELSTKRYLDSNVDQDTSSDFNSFKKENVTIYDETDCRTSKQKFASTENIYEEKEIDKITDGEPKEILDVEEREYLPTHVSKHKTERKDKSDYFQIKSPIGGAEEMKIDYEKKLPTQRYLDSYINQDTSYNFDSFKENITIFDKNYQTLDSTVWQKSESFKNIPEEEGKIEKEKTSCKAVVSDVKEKTEFLAPTSKEFQTEVREESDFFILKTPKSEKEQANTDKKELLKTEYYNLDSTSAKAEKRKDTSILIETDEDPSKHPNYLNGLQDTNDIKGFPEIEYDSDATPLENATELSSTTFTNKTKDILTDERLIAQEDFDISAAVVPRKSVLRDDQLKLRDYLYGLPLPDLNKKYSTGNETTLEIEKSNVYEKVISKEDAQLIEKVDIPTLLMLSLDCLTERGYKKDGIWKALGTYFDKKKKEFQKNIGLEKVSLITQKTEKLRINLSSINYKLDTEPTFDLQSFISHKRKTARNGSYKICSHMDVKRDFEDFDEKLKDFETDDIATDRKKIIDTILLNRGSEIGYIQHKTIFKNGIKRNKIIDYSPDVPTNYVTKWFEKDSSKKQLNNKDKLCLQYFQHSIAKENTPGYEKLNEYETDSDNYSSSDSEKNIIKQIINKHAVQNNLNTLDELTYRYKTSAAQNLGRKNKLKNLIYFPKETPKLIYEEKEYQKSKYLNSEFYKKRKEKLDLEFYNWYLKSKKQYGEETVKRNQPLDNMYYNFMENESNLQILPSPPFIQDTNIFKDHLNISQIHYFNKEQKKEYTTTEFLRDSTLENEELSSVYKEKYTEVLSHEKTHKIPELEKYTNIDSQEPVTEDNELKNYLNSTGEVTISDIFNDVQRVKATNAVSEILESHELEMQKDSKSKVTYFKKIIDEIIKEVEIEQIKNGDVSVSNNVLATRPQKIVAHKVRLEYEQLDIEETQSIDNTSSNGVKTTVKETVLSENEQSSETEERMQKLKHLRNGTRIIEQYPTEDLEGLSSHFNVITKANSEENITDKSEEETDICLISANFERTAYSSTAMNEDSAKEIQNKLTESSSSIVEMYDKNMYLRSIEEEEKIAHTTSELADTNDEKLHKDYLPKSHTLHSASQSYSPEHSVKEKSSFNFISDICEDLKIFQRDTGAKGTLEGYDRSQVDMDQSHCLSVSQRHEFSDDLMPKKPEILTKDETCKLNMMDLSASVSLTVKKESESAERKQNFKTENQKAIDTCKDTLLFHLNDQLGFFYNLTKPLVSKNCEITRNMKKWAPVKSAEMHKDLLEKKRQQKKAKIAKISDMILKSDEDFILPSKVRCLDASDISDMVAEIEPTSMVSFIDSSDRSFGQVSEQLESEMDAEKLKDNIEMYTKVADKMTLKQRTSDLKYFDSAQNEIDNSIDYQIKSDESYKTKPHQKDEAQIKNYRFFELEEKNTDLNSAKDFLFPVHLHNQKPVPDMTDYQLLQTNFENLTIKDSVIMQSDGSEKVIKQSLAAMDKCKDRTCSKKEIIYDPKLCNSSHKLGISIKSEINEGTLLHITNENIDLPCTDKLTNVLIIDETNKLSIPDFEPSNSNDLKCNFDLIQNVSKHKIVNSSIECTNGTKISPIETPYESIIEYEISEHSIKRGNTEVLIKNVDSDSSIKHENQIETEPNSDRQQEIIESFSCNIEDNTNLKSKTQVQYNDNNQSSDILLLNRHTDKDLSITRHFFFDKSSSSPENLDFISINVKFSNSPINTKLNANKFKVFLNNCISEILQKCKENKSTFIVDESDSNTDIVPQKNLDCTLDTNPDNDLSKMESFLKEVKNQQNTSNITEILNKSQIQKDPQEKNTNIEAEQPDECHDKSRTENRNYKDRKSLIRKVMDPITRKRDSISHKEKTGCQTHDKQYPFKNTDIFITKDIKSSIDDFKDDSDSQITYFPWSPEKANKFVSSNANSTFQTSSNDEKMFETNSKTLNNKSSELNKAEGLLPIISTAREINLKIMDIAEERTQNLKCHLKVNQEKSTDATFMNDDQDKS